VTHVVDTEGEREKWRRANRVGIWLIVAPLSIGVVVLLVGVVLQVA
jgi:hypothetical protein